MKIVWPILFGFACLMQFSFVLVAIQTHLPSSSNRFDFDAALWLRVIVFGFSALLAVFTGKIITNNYPDKVIVGRQKTFFNIACFIGLILIPFLIYFVIMDYNQTPSLARISKMHFGQLHAIFGLLFPTAASIFHVLILFGLFRLRNFINSNVRNKKFSHDTNKLAH